MTGPLSEILFRLRAGPLKLSRWVADRLLDRRRDRYFGIASAERRSVRELGFSSAEYVDYQAVSYPDMEELLDIVRPGVDDVFLDLGCGMGRAVCVTAMRPMRSVIGVEISPELCEIARDNVRRVAGRLKCPSVEIVNSDAASYVIPDSASIFFFFNPFSGTVLARVFDNVRRSLQASPRLVRLVFYGTVSSARFEIEATRHQWLAMESKNVLRSGILVVVYRSIVGGACDD